MQEMVVGLHFNEHLNKVVLIRKEKPDWQKGKLNGVGGKIEHGETTSEAMIREYKEETGVTTDHNTWQYFAQLCGEDFKVYFFFASGDISNVKSMEEEKIEILNTGDITIYRQDMVENLPWIIGLAYDKAVDGRPGNVIIYY